MLEIDNVTASLSELDDLIYCEDYCTEGGFSYDDIDLVSFGAALTVIKGVQWPEKTWKYMKNLSVRGDVPLGLHAVLSCAHHDGNGTYYMPFRDRHSDNAFEDLRLQSNAKAKAIIH